MNLEEQIQQFDSLGIPLDLKWSMDELLRVNKRCEYESRPCDLLWETLFWRPFHSNIQGDIRFAMSSVVWAYDAACIYKGSYVYIVERLAEMTGREDSLEILAAFTSNQLGGEIRFRLTSKIHAYQFPPYQDWSSPESFSSIMIDIAEVGHSFYRRAYNELVYLSDVDADQIMLLLNENHRLERVS